MPDEKKEKVIHTRIPAALEEQIKRLAEGLRVPVSNLVRNMLEDAIDVTRRVRDAVGNGKHDDLADIFGWQALTLNVDANCGRCQRELGAGDDAYMGLTDRPRQDMARVFICTGCLPRKTKSGKKKERE